ncbi:MAG: AraC family transcriptional regulator [Verrucomicrobia bacterium]|nr:AraC family transcriptional regulator [Verrucomicrobiota bacterium]
MRSDSPSNRVAIFTDKSERYAADTCEALSAAARRGEVRMAALVRGAYPGRTLPGKVLAGVCSVGFWDAAHSQHWGLDWHRNEGLEITFLERGVLSFGIGGESVDLRPGALTITRPWQPHRVGNPNIGPSRLHWLILDLGVRRPNQAWRWPSWLMLAPEDLKRLTELLRHHERAIWMANEDIRRCWQRISQAIEEDVRGSSHSRLRVQINELLLLLVEMLVRSKPQLDPSLTSSMRTIELFLAELQHNPEQRSHPWTVGEMAGRCGLGATHFVSLCRQLTNVTPAHYLTWCRVEAACELLEQDPDGSITDVALACGFSSAQYFATVFRQKLGVTPKEYREGRRDGRARSRAATVRRRRPGNLRRGERSYQVTNGESRNTRPMNFKQ